MWRALIVLILVIGGATGLAFGQRVRDELTAAMGEGSGVPGAVRSFVVAVSPAHQAQVDTYRISAQRATWVGGVLLVLGLVVGLSGRGGSQRAKAGAAGTARAARSDLQKAR